jgi:pimeloyl-ACP methyl ester carboxylesterase
VARAQELLLPSLIHKARLGETQLVTTIMHMAVETGLDAFRRQEEAIIGRPDSRPVLANIRCPTLVLVGEQDALTPVEAAREIADGIAGAKLAIVPDCGHLSTLEQPEAVSRALREWLASDAPGLTP